MVFNSKGEEVVFDWINYSVFFGMLLGSTLIGVYFGCCGKKQTASEYLLGGQTMRVLPVALSLAASHISGNTLIGVPAEVYTDGSLYWLTVPSLIFVCLFVSYFILPVICNLKITSAYEYLELRFNRTMRSFASFFYLIHCFLFLPPMIYVPSISLSQVTGINLHIITVGVTAVCVFYTMIGGLKAVVWTDFLQTVITIAACLAIVIIGTIDAGGFSHVMNLAAEHGRIDIFKMDPNPFQRNTFWTVLIGTLFSWGAGISSSQGSIQRFMSVPSLHHARKVLIIYFFGISFIMTLSVYGGILLFSTYYGCDPVEQKIVKKVDQLFPYFVLDKIGYIPALPGLFVAGVFSAALSSLSTALNTLSGTIYEDYIKIRGVSEEKAPMIMKTLVVIIGVLCVLMVMVVEKMGNIVPVSYKIAGVTGAPVFAMFLFGMMIPFANSKGTLAAAFSSMIFLGWIAIGSHTAKVTQNIKPIYDGIPSTCLNANETIFDDISTLNSTMSTPAEEDDVFILYKLSYMLYKAFGIILCLIVGVIVCYITGPTDVSTVDPKLISPPMRRFLPAKIVKESESAEQKFVPDKNIERGD